MLYLKWAAAHYMVSEHCLLAAARCMVYTKLFMSSCTWERQIINMCHVKLARGQKSEHLAKLWNRLPLPCSVEPCSAHIDAFITKQMSSTWCGAQIMKLSNLTSTYLGMNIHISTLFLNTICIRPKQCYQWEGKSYTSWNSHTTHTIHWSDISAKVKVIFQKK